MSTAPATGTTSPRSAIQKAAVVVAIVFLLVGIAGFIPGLTTNVGDLMFAGHHSEAMLLGIFQVSILHNAVHILYGIAGLVLARTFSAARTYFLAGGAVYALLWLYGLFVPHDSSANFVPLNNADNWLHLVLAVGMIALGLLLGRRGDTARRDTARRAG